MTIATLTKIGDIGRTAMIVGGSIFGVGAVTTLAANVAIKFETRKDPAFKAAKEAQKIRDHELEVQRRADHKLEAEEFAKERARIGLEDAEENIKMLNKEISEKDLKLKSLEEKIRNYEDYFRKNPLNGINLSFTSI